MSVELGEAIRHRREQLGLSQGALARTTGINAQQLGRYELGRNEPSLSMAMRIARALSCSLDDLTSEDRRARRLAALQRARAEFTGTYPPGYLKALRDEWPD